MSVFGHDITDDIIKKMRAFYKRFLDSNPDLRAIVAVKTKGLRGKKRDLAYKKAVRALLKRNAVFLKAANDKVKELRGV
jgi:hypothetical protein